MAPFHYDFQILGLMCQDWLKSCNTQGQTVSDFMGDYDSLKLIIIK